MTLNPMAVIIDGYRRCVAQGRAPDVPLTGVAALISLAVLWLSYRYFKRLERRFADLA